MLADFLEKNEIRTFNQPISSDQIDLLKANLNEELNDKQDQIHRLYLSKKQDINRIDVQTKKLIDQCEQLEGKRKKLIEQIDEYSKLENQARHVNSNYHEIHHLNRFIHGIKQVIQLQNQIQECRHLCKKRQLNEAKTLFQSIERLTQDPYLFPTHIDRSSVTEDSFYETLQRSLRQLRSDLSQTHSILWNDGVHRRNKTELVLSTDDLDRLFQCSFDDGRGERQMVEKHIQTLATYCLQGFIHVLIEKRSRLIIEEQDESTKILFRIENEDEHDESTSDGIEQFNQTLIYLGEFFQTLNTYLLSRLVKMPTSDQKSADSITVMTLFSRSIVNDFIELVREHLLNLIPDDFEDIEAFRSLLDTVIRFERQLIEMKFFSDSRVSNVLSSVVGNIDEAIVKSRCRTYLNRSRALLQSNAAMTTSLKTIEFGDAEDLFEQNESEKKRYKAEAEANILSPTISLDELDANMFRFPRTTIVEHVHEYMESVRTVLREADQMENYGAHLCAVARNMMELFHVIYASIHEKEAQELPYLAALHFNTYMYVAHQCLILGEEYYHLKRKTGDGQPITFVDYVPVFRNQAMHLLKSQLDTQKETLSSFIHEIGAFHNIVDEEHHQDLLKRAISQCILHVENLSHQWRKVFSVHVYFKVIGYLCDHVSHLLIKETLLLEDIPEQECQVMVNGFTQWLTFLQNSLVKDSFSPGLNILARLAPNLTRFQEMCLLLNSSLQTIVDRWFNGQGPLASQFTATEVKQLIRALFQSSDRRTAALAKIQ